MTTKNLRPTKSRPLHRKIAATLCCALILLAGTPSSIASEPNGSATKADNPMPAPTSPAPMDEMEVLRSIAVAPLNPDQALDKRHIGKRVRWAGGVHHIARSDKGVCLTILYALSGKYGEPAWTVDPTYQSFNACTTGAYDPELVSDFTNVTIVGKISGKTYIGMGGGGGDGPVVEIEKLYRWSDCLAGDTSPVCKHGFLTPEVTTDD